MNNEEWRNKDAGKVIRDLHTYCFCSQPTWRRMGYRFSEGDFDLLHNLIEGQTAEIEMLKHDREKLKRELITTKYEVIKELSEKITEIFARYAHLHAHADEARKDCIETVDGKEIEMQSVWDVITLQMNGIAEYEEMSRLQKNIETIGNDRLLIELEKEFWLLIKELGVKKDER